MGTVAVSQTKTMLTLPGDAVRQIQWRYAERFDLQMLVQSARSVARGTVARLVAAGERNTHEWTPAKAEMLEAFDRSGITAVFMEPEEGGFISGPKNLALALTAFELAWVDGGAATASLASFLALSPIHERGTKEQVTRYKTLAAPPQAGEDRVPWRGAFALTEPIPYVGVDTGMLNGKMRVADWNEGAEPWLQVDKRGRFITNIAFANFVTAAVGSDDPRIKGTCVVILEDGDEGSFERGTPTKKLVHQLSSTGDPVFNLKVPASRIVGGYTVKDGVIVPNFNHGEIIEAVFRRTRVPVGLMTAAKLLSAVEPVIRYQRERFRGAEGSKPGSVRYEQGIQQREDALHRLVDVWATGEAAASLGFAAARLFDELDPLERNKSALLKERGIQGGRAEMKALKESEQRAIELLSLKRDDPRRAELEADPLVEFVLKDAEANVICPATKLWNTGHGANMMREAVSLMGGYGITEDCPGFLANKWMDAQLEATYEGPEAVQRRQLTVTMTSEVFLAQFRAWTADMRRIASDRPGTGACTLAIGNEAVAMDPRSPAESHRSRRQQALSRTAAGRNLCPGRRALLAAGFARTRFWTCWSSRHAARATPWPPRGLRAPCSFSATFATRRPRKPPARFRASAPNWSSATTEHPSWADRGHTRAASWPANWKRTRRPCRALPPWPWM